jgi:hypothetical protein
MKEPCLPWSSDFGKGCSIYAFFSEEELLEGTITNFAISSSQLTGSLISMVHTNSEGTLAREWGQEFQERASVSWLVDENAVHLVAARIDLAQEQMSRRGLHQRERVFARVILGGEGSPIPRKLIAEVVGGFLEIRAVKRGASAAADDVDDAIGTIVCIAIKGFIEMERAIHPIFRSRVVD